MVIMATSNNTTNKLWSQKYICLVVLNESDVRGSVHHSTIHKEKSNKMQHCINILLFHVYTKLYQNVNKGPTRCNSM